jgi:hypothetical protein
MVVLFFDNEDNSYCNVITELVNCLTGIRYADVTGLRGSRNRWVHELCDIWHTDMSQG